MSRKTRQARTPRIEQVSQRIENWRRTRERRTRMPEPLWKAAVAVAREDGLYATSRRLRVNYESLKARVGGGAKRSRPSAGFVELSPAPAIGTPPVGGLVVELVGAGGEKLTIRLAEAGDVDVAALARDFWSRSA
jgi:hypothetical protein